MPRNVRADAEMPSALTCADVRAREWDFVEGALPLPERAAVQTHLDACEACRHSVTLCRNAENALRAGVTQIPPAGDLRSGFYARLAAEQRSPRRFGRPLALSALAAGLLAVALLRPTLPIPHSGTVPSTRAIANRTRAVSPSSAVTTPVIAPNADADARTEALALAPHSVPGLSEAQVDRLFQDLNRRYPVLVPSHTASNGRIGIRAIHSIRTAARRPKPHATTDNRTTIVSPALAAGKPVEQPSVTNGFLAGHFQEKGTPHFDSAAHDYAKNDVQVFSRDRRAEDWETHGDKVMGGLGKSELADKKSADHPVVTALMPAQPNAGVSLAVTDDVRHFSTTTRIAADVEEQADGTTFHIAAGDDSH